MKKLKNYLNDAVERLDTAIGSAYVSSSLIDAITVAINYGKERFTGASIINGMPGLNGRYLLEDAFLAKNSIRGLGLVPGTVASLALETGMSLLLAWGLYKSADYTIDKASKRFKILEKLDKPFIKKLPSYVFLLTGTYSHIKGIESWV